MRSKTRRFIDHASAYWMTLMLMALTVNPLSAQSDSLRNEIARYVSKEEAISANGRLMLRDLISTHGDTGKIRSVLRVVQMELNPFYRPLTRTEESGIRFLLGDFEEVLRMFDHVEDTILLEADTYHAADNLLKAIQSRIINDSTRIAEAIDGAEMNIVSKAFLRLYYSKITSWPRDYTQRLALNQKVKIFIEEFPASKFDKSVRAYIGEVYGPTGWSQRLYFQGGLYQLRDHLSQRFTNPWTIGFGLDISRERFSFLFRSAVGSCITKDSIPFNAVTWGKAYDVEFEIMEFAAGYKAVTSERLDVVPFMGCSWTNFKPAEKDEQNNPALKQIGFRKKPAYTVGISADVRIKKDRMQDEKVRYDKFVRLRYAYEMPRLQRTMPGFDGSMHSITIAIGVAVIWQYRQL